ncbi:TlpA disulfide reductase family protein [Oscillospiraceae bacterium MB08-C2-2]|nr:TlpA disulfide reductase family protein [Oscillospiraceae bacterium MB08-C2-2]
MKKKFLILSLALTLSLAACGKGDISTSQPAETLSEPSSQAQQSIPESSDTSSSEPEEMPLVPDFTVQANNGESVSLSSYAGKVVVLNFWASWCPPCKAEMPDFQILHDELADSEEVVLLLLNQTDGQRETKEKADKYLADNSHTFMNLYDTGEVGFGIFGIQSIPTTVVIDKEGRLSDFVLGKTDLATVKQMIEEAKNA